MRKKNSFTDIFIKLVGHETQQEIADKIGVSRQNIGKWLSGNTTPDIVTLCMIAKAYNVSTDYLLGLSNVSSPSMEVRTVCEITGLSQKSVDNILNMKNNKLSINLLFEDANLEQLIKYLEEIRNIMTGRMYYNKIISPIINTNDFYDSLVKNGLSMYKLVDTSHFESSHKNQESSDTVNYDHRYICNQNHERDCDYLFNIISDLFSKIIFGDIGVSIFSENTQEEYQNKLDLLEFKMSKILSSILCNLKKDCETHFGEISEVRNVWIRDRIKERLEQAKLDFADFEEYKRDNAYNPCSDEVRVLQTYLDKYDENFKLKEQKGAPNNGSNNPKKE